MPSLAEASEGASSLFGMQRTESRSLQGPIGMCRISMCLLPTLESEKKQFSRLRPLSVSCTTWPRRHDAAKRCRIDNASQGSATHSLDGRTVVYMLH
jgi:hypothetical protein